MQASEGARPQRRKFPCNGSVERDLCARTAANACIQILSGMPKDQEAYATFASRVEAEVHGISQQFHW